MVSAKALAAIGLTLVIVIPIGLGYALALDETETTRWEASGGASLSDLLLNSETPYFNEYTGPSNNSQLIITRYAPGVGTMTEVGSPTYVTVGPTYSSIPEYASVTGSKALTAHTVTNYNLGDGSIGYGPDYVTKLTGGDYVVMDITSDASSLHWELSYDGRLTYTKDLTTAIRDGPDSWEVHNPAIPGGVAHGVRSWGFTTDATGTVKVVKGSYTVMGVTGSYSFTLQNYGLKLTRTGGAVEYVAHSGSLGPVVVSSQGTVQADGRTVQNVVSVAVVTSAGFSAVDYTSVSPTGSYAAIGDGWTVPADASSVKWFNGSVNDSVTMYAAIPSGTTLGLTKYLGDTASRLLEINNTGTTLTVGNRDLGAYDHVRISIGSDGYDVTGIMAWPDIGAPVEEYNSVKVTTASALFDSIRIGGDSGITYRVDGASVLAGYYASTEDLTIDIASLYPGKAFEVTISSVGVYGTTFGIDTWLSSVNNGQITIDGTRYPVRGLRISAVPADSGYTVSVNGTVLDRADTPTIHFGGEWSVGAYVSTMEQVTVKNLTWRPGEFGIDKETLGAAGLLCCLGAFAVLGLTGSRSGYKIALLGLVLGGAAITYLIIL